MSSSSGSAKVSSGGSVSDSSSGSSIISSSSSSSAGPYYELLYVGGSATNIKYRSMALGADNILYAAPYHADLMLEFNPVTDTGSFTVSTAAHGTGNQRWIDMILASDGKLYANAHQASGGYLEIDTSTDPISLASYGSNFQTRGGDEVAGVIYSTKYSGNAPVDDVITLNISTKATSSINYTVDRTGNVYYARPDWSTENTAQFGIYDRYWGATASGTKVYGTPYGSDRILIVDTVAGTAFQGNDQLTGNDTIPTGPLTSFMINDSAYFNKYSGGTPSSVNGKIYCFPRHARSILKIDPTNDSATEIPLPSPVVDSFTKSRSFSSVEGPDGRIYSVPWQLNYLFWIDPVDDSIGYIDITEITDQEVATNGYWTYGAVYGDSIYYAPGKAQNVLKITPSLLP